MRCFAERLLAASTLGGCAALWGCLSVAPPPAPTASPSTVIADARLLLGAGASGALRSVDASVEQRLTERIAEANALVDALEAYMFALRDAFPLSSEVEPGAVSLALLPREAAESAWSDARAVDDWSRQYPTLALTQAREFLDAAERLLEAAATPGDRMAMAWADAATAYAAWCQAAAKLSERTEATAMATWLTSP
jgi:hypothetical protein